MATLLLSMPRSCGVLGQTFLSQGLPAFSKEVCKDMGRGCEG